MSTQVEPVETGSRRGLGPVEQRASYEEKGYFKLPGQINDPLQRDG